MIDRILARKRTIVLGALAVLVVAWGAVALVATTSPMISITAGAAILVCAVAWAIVQRSRAAHDRAIADNYPSFGPALERRRAEGRASE
ncbi:MAG: hypothetical protein ACXVQT_09745 [Actinomycetota bacterium]